MSEALNRLGRIEADIAAIKDLLQRQFGEQVSTAGGVQRRSDGALFSPGTGLIEPPATETIANPVTGETFVRLASEARTALHDRDPA